MATHFIWQDGPNGSGTSPEDTRRTVPALSNNDVVAFKCGAPFLFTNQLSITATNTRWTWFGDPTLGMPRWKSTAGNFGLINVATASGVTTFEHIEFRDYLTGSTNGAIINCSVTSGRASSVRVRYCGFATCAWNAIRQNGTNTSEAALLFECTDSWFWDIGEDCYFGCALDFRFKRNWCKRMSSRTTTGDCIGMINGDPVYVDISDNWIDHSDFDTKQCIIIDTSGAATGRCYIEDNTLIGYGSATQAPTVHSVVICDMPLTMRGNDVYTWGLTAGCQHGSDVIRDNVFHIGNRDQYNVAIAIAADGGSVDHNTFIGHAALPTTTRIVVMAEGVTTGNVRNNIFVNVPIAVKSDSLGNNPTVENNVYWGVTSQRLDRDGVAFSGTDEVTVDPQLRDDDYMPLAPQIRESGKVLGGADFFRKRRASPPTPGAVQFQRYKQQRRHLAKAA